MQDILTFGANAWEFFTIGSEAYLAVANSHRNVTNAADQGDVRSAIYRWSNATANFVRMQTIMTHMALDVQYFEIDGSHYLAFANSPCFRPVPQHVSPIYRWNGSAFALYQEVTTSGATGWEHFTLESTHFLVVANRLCRTTGHRCESEIFTWNGTRFIQNQTIATNGAYDWTHFVIDSDHFLVVANNADMSATQPGVGQSEVFRWFAGRFAPYESIATNGAEQWRHFAVGGQHYLAVAQMATDNVSSKLFRWVPSSDAS